MNMLNFKQPPNTLIYGINPCPNNHTDKNGRIVRRIRGPANPCWACCCKQPAGMFDFDFGNLPMQVDKRIKYDNDEDRRKAHIERVMQWNKDNPETFNRNQKNYYERHKEEEIAKKMKYYYDNHEVMKARHRQYYQNKKQRKLNDSINDSNEKSKRKAVSDGGKAVATELVQRIFGS